MTQFRPPCPICQHPTNDCTEENHNDHSREDGA